MTDTTTSQPSTLTQSTSPTSFQTTDSAPGTPNDDDDDDSIVPGGMASYYFVFLMLTLCVIGVVIFLNFRRRRKRRLQLLHGRGRDDAWNSDTAGARGRRYWQGRWGSAHASREEGLNEHGEAPPPYVPKRPSQEVRREGADGNGSGGQAADGGPAVPLQTLSREHAGLKPPDYEDDMMRPRQQPGNGGSSSQQPETREGH